MMRNFIPKTLNVPANISLKVQRCRIKKAKQVNNILGSKSHNLRLVLFKSVLVDSNGKHFIRED